MSNALEFLLKIRELSKIVSSYEEEYETLMSRLTSVTYRLKTVDVMKSKEDTFAETVEEMSNAKGLFIDKLNEFAKMRIEAEEYVRQVEDFRHQTVLIKYFFQHKTLEQTAVDMDMSYRWVCDLKDVAVKRFEKIYENSKKNSICS